MAAVTLLPTALRGSVTTPTFTLPTSAPVAVRIKMISPTFPTDPSLTFVLALFRSPDGIQPFAGWCGTDGVGGGLGQPGKFGVPMDGLFQMGCSFDGVACVAKATITVNTPFVWGLTAEVVP